MTKEKEEEEVAEEIRAALREDSEVSKLFEVGGKGTSIVLVASPEVEETFEQREARLKREDYARRNLAAIPEREDVLRRNGVIGPDEKLTMDTEAAIRQRCCI